MESWNQHFRSTEVESYSERPLMCKFCKKTQTTRARCRIKPWEARGRNCTFYKIWILDHGRSQNSERGTRVDMRTRKRSYVQEDFTNWISDSSDEDGRNIGDNVVFTKSSSSVTEAWKNLHRKFQRVYESLPRFTMKSLQKHLSSLSRPQSERRNSCRTRAKRTTRRIGGTVRWTAAVYLRNVQDSIPTRCVARSLTDHQFFLGHWLSTSQLPVKEKSRVHHFGKKIVKGIFLGCVLRAGGGWSGDLMTAANDNLQASEASETYVTRFKWKDVFAERRTRIPVRKRNSETSWSSKTVIDSMVKPRAGRWCWNRRKRQKGKKNRRFVVQEWIIYFSTSWRISFEVLRSS